MFYEFNKDCAMSKGGHKIFSIGYTGTSIIGKNISVDGVLKDTLAQMVFPGRSVIEAEIVDRINSMDGVKKRILKKKIEANSFFNPRARKYRGGIHESTYYLRTPITMCETLDNAKKTSFAVDVSVGREYSFISKQYVEMRLKKPVPLDENFVVPQGKKLKYFFTRFPAIRAVEELKLYADTVEVESFNYMTNFKQFKDNITDNYWEHYNEIIGEDMGTEAEMYSPLSETIIVQKIKVGLQTPKDDHGTITMATPLIYSFNKDFNDKFNISNFNPGTVNMKGSFAKSTDLVRGFLYSDDNVDPPIPVPLAPLEFECHPELVTEISAVDDVWWALNYDVRASHVYDYEEVEYYTATELRSEFKLSGRGEVTQMAVAARPLSYHGTFENWYNLSHTIEVCHPNAIILQGPNNMLNVGISSAVAKKSVSVIEEIDLAANEISLLIDKKARNFSQYEIFSKSRNDPIYHARTTNELLYLNFNPDVNGKVISNFFNMSAFSKPVLTIRLSDSLQSPAKNGDLKEKIQIIVYRKIINGIQQACDSMAKTTF
jgi:hypothetical protein